MYVDVLLALGLFAAIAVLAVWHWETAGTGDDHEPPTLDTRNHLDE